MMAPTSELKFKQFRKFVFERSDDRRGPRSIVTASGRSRSATDCLGLRDDAMGPISYWLERSP